MKKQNRNQNQTKVFDASQYIREADRIEIGRRLVGPDISDSRALLYFNVLCYAPNCYSLDKLASILDIPGGGEAIEKLLLACGFLTGAFRSEHAHLPYQRFLDRGYFMVRTNIDIDRRKAKTFFITRKGLPIVLKKLMEFRIYIPTKTIDE